MSNLAELRQVILEKKTRISAIGQRIPVVMYLFLWAIIAVLMAYVAISMSQWAFLGISVVSLFFGFLAYKSLSVFRKVYADENFMYVTYKGVEEVVPLESIYAGSKPILKVASALESVKFYYKTPAGDKKVVKFVPRQLNDMYNRFLDACEAKNAQIKIKRSFI
ncbi:MAG: hypothetical protein CVU11_11445 [Bacteroidetes bacterium HGW-Bacteroidetes-6]|jgi:hypothetical protein|nr:MAG: hypothetical protein CVU11_11445 [Bacteroidetes bacterium HGW-Bacteroidetes-6]